MIVYVENTKEPTVTKVPLELIRYYSKLARHNFNIPKSTALMYINNETLQHEIKSILFKLIPKNKMDE